MNAALDKTGKWIVCAAVVMGLSLGAAWAHHSFTAEFDPNKPIELSGKVTRMLWSNPHAWIYVDVEGPDGEIVNWGFETGTANSLIRRGWRPVDLEPGTEVLVEGWQARSGQPVGNARSVTFTDGRRLFAGTSNTAVQDEQ